MYYPKHERRKHAPTKRESFSEAVQLALDLHAMAHLSEISGCSEKTYEDESWEDIPEKTFA